jgi:ABC transporter DrrB family efflux protein
VLFLDEPTTGLDPRTRNELWGEITKLVDHGATVVLTTQYLEEADRLANRIALIGDGRIISEGTAGELKASIGSDVVELTVCDAKHTSAAANALTSSGDGPCGPVRTDETARQVSVSVHHGEETVAAVLRRFEALDIPIDTIELRHPTLDEAYLAATSPRAAPAVEHNGSHAPVLAHTHPRTAGEGISLRSALADTLAIARRDLRNYARNPTIMVGTILRPLLILLIFRFVLQGSVEDELPRGVSYIDFLLPGIFILAVVVAANETGIGVANEMSARVVDRFRALPMARCAVLGGRAISDAARNLVVIAVLTVAGFFFGFRVHTGIPQLALALLLVLSVGFAFSWITIAIAMKVREPEAISTLAFLWSYPLTFLSSIYVPVNTMPAGIETLARANPVTHFTDAVRALTIGTPAGRSIVLSVIWIVAILAVCVPYTIRRYRLAD